MGPQLVTPGEKALALQSLGPMFKTIFFRRYAGRLRASWAVVRSKQDSVDKACGMQ